MTDRVTAYLSLGSNLGNRQANLDRALEYLGQAMQIDRVSPIYETDPVGTAAQPRFLNLACRVKTLLTPQALLALAKGIERKMGRVGRTGEPRPIDIDILLYGEEIVSQTDLEIPHPRMVERAFVLVPLAEIAPDVRHPVTGRTAKEMLAAVTEKQGVFRWEDE